MLSTNPTRERANHFVVVTATFWWLDDLRTQQNMLVTTALIKVIMLEKHSGRKNNISDLGGLRHKLLVHANEKIFSREARMHSIKVRCHGHRVGVLNK